MNSDCLGATKATGNGETSRQYGKPPAPFLIPPTCGRRGGRVRPHGLQASAPANNAVTPLGMRLLPQEGDRNAAAGRPPCAIPPPDGARLWAWQPLPRGSPVPLEVSRRLCNRPPPAGVRLFQLGTSGFSNSGSPDVNSRRSVPGSLLQGSFAPLSPFAGSRLFVEIARSAAPHCLLVYSATTQQCANSIAVCLDRSHARQSRAVAAAFPR